MKTSAVDGSLLVSGKNAKVGGRTDVRHGLSKLKSLITLAQAEPDWGESDVRAVMKKPVLIVFPLRGTVRSGTKPDVKTTLFRDGQILPALALHFPGVRDPDGPKNLVRYRLNRVAQAELFPPDLDDDDDEDDPDQED